MPAPKNPNTEAARAALAAKRAAEKQQREIVAARQLLQGAGWLVLSSKQVIDHLAEEISGDDGISAHYLWGYLGLNGTYIRRKSCADNGKPGHDHAACLARAAGINP